MHTHRIAAIPGDGIGTEVIAAGIEALDACAKRDGGFAFAFDHFDWGSERYKKTGAFMPENGRDLIKDHDAILFGSAGAPDVPDHITLWGLRLAICQPFDQYANVRPTRILPGITSPLRNVTGSRARLGDRARELGRRICRRRRARASRPARGSGDRRVDVHPRGRRAHHALCLRAGPLAAAQAADRRDQVERAAPRHGDVGRDRGRGGARVSRRDLGQDAGRRHDHAHDACKPQTLDTIVATNLHADILSDLAAALAGSLGIAPTANLNPERKFPSMFEPIHGSAFDIMGKGIANPIGTFWSGVMMLEHLGEKRRRRRG